jgi:putative endonuclease
MADGTTGQTGTACGKEAAGRVTLGSQIESLDLPDEVRAVLREVLEPHWDDGGCTVAVMEMSVCEPAPGCAAACGEGGRPDPGTDRPDGRRPSATRDLGIRGERLAARYMAECGYRILERNYRTSFGEADLICERDGEVVFVEVKTRSGLDALPEEGVDGRKIRRYRSMARDYLRTHDEFDAARFDVLAVNVGASDEVQIHHFVSVCGWDA